MELTSNYIEQGNDFDKFFSLIEEIDNSTYEVEMHLSDLKLYAMWNSDSDYRELALMSGQGTFSDNIAKFKKTCEQQNKANKICFALLFPNECMKHIAIDKQEFVNYGIDEPFMHEFENASKLMFKLDKHTYFVSPLAFNTLLRRARLGGEAMVSPSIGRAMEIFKTFQWKNYDSKDNKKAKLIVRKKDNVELAIAMHSPKYCYVPQKILADIYNEISNGNITAKMGMPNCEKWVVTHEISLCYMNFPDLAEDVAMMYNQRETAIPGVCIATSDSGESSLTIRGYWKLGTGYIAGSSFKRQHRGEIDTKEFVESSLEQIYSEYTTIPDRLAELLCVDVYDVPKILKKVFKQIGMTVCLGDKRSQLMYDTLCAELSSQNNTAYDLALAIVSLQDRIQGVERSTIEKYEKVAYKAIFADYTDTQMTIAP